MEDGTDDIPLHTVGGSHAEFLVDLLQRSAQPVPRGLRNIADTAPPQKRSRHARRGQSLQFFHGTSWASARSIMAVGRFAESEDGCLGRGVYVAREDKARRFAEDRQRHGGRHGGLLTVIISFQRPKYVEGNDTTWQREGYDACRTDATSASTNMEWCVADASQVEILKVERVDIN